MKKIFVLGLVLIFATLVWAENYLLNGGQDSRIDYSLEQRIEVVPGIQTMKLSYVVPESYNSPTYIQRIEKFSLNFVPKPEKQLEQTDNRGNRIIRVEFTKPQATIIARISLLAINRVELKELNTSAPFPPTNIPAQFMDYLSPTGQVQADNPAIRNRARELTAGAKTEFDAVQRILTWVVDNMRYVLTPKQYDAMWSFEGGTGNCQNYSHLAAALMRAVGIPVRIVNGVTLKQPYDINIGREIFTIKMAQGRHSWIEVYFPDLGWVPFDPQQTQLYVSNRFIRIETGLDNNETTNDGLIRWTQMQGTAGSPALTETVNGEFLTDKVELNAKRASYGPKKVLLTPPVLASFEKKLVTERVEPESKPVPADVQNQAYTRPFFFGNLEFPRNLSFLGGGEPQAGDQGFEIRKNFLVETAEYVTSGAQYAQIFILEKPMKVQVVSLALHKFGGDGQIWLELLQDDNGKPGSSITTSQLLDVDVMKMAIGYDWVNFEFGSASPILPPGRYWIAFGFTGSPIINWFYSYGKPVGPEDGTRYKLMFDEQWSRSLSFEFNYRVAGLATAK